MTDAHVPPQNLDAEENVLGAIMLSSKAIVAVADEVRPEDFYRESHALIFKAALGLDARGEPVDALTLSAELERLPAPHNDGTLLEHVGGKVRIQELAATVPATANAAHYARLIRETSKRRALLRAGSEIVRLGWEGLGDIDEVIAQAEQRMADVSSASYAGEFSPISDPIDDLYAQISEAVRTQTPLSGLSTGFPDLDNLLTGLYDSNLIIIGARPGVGKSLLVQNALENIADQGKAVALFTLEMSKREVGLRSLVRQTKLDMKRLRTGRLSPEELKRVEHALPLLRQRPFFVEDSGSVTMPELRARAKRLKAKHDLKVLAVDYIQLMVPGETAESRQTQVAQISRSLKLLAMELDIPVIGVSQLSRKTEYREDKRPTLADLRESGAIEQDANVVIFLYREETYRAVEAAQAGEAEVIIAKNRMGELGTIKLLFLGRQQKFATPAKYTDNGGNP